MEIVLFIVILVVVKLVNGNVGYNVNTGWISSKNRSYFRKRFK